MPGRHKELSERHIQVIDALTAAGGTIEAPNGHCAAILCQATGLTPDQAMGAVKYLANRGLVDRDTRAKQTFRVSLVNFVPLKEREPETAPVLELVESVGQADDHTPNVNLDDLADALLRRCVDVLDGPELARIDAERLSTALDEAQRYRIRLRNSENELEGVRNELTTLRRRVRLLEGDKRTLQANLDQALRSGGRVVHEQVKAGIARFMQETPSKHESRVGAR